MTDEYATLDGSSSSPVSFHIFRSPYLCVQNNNWDNLNGNCHCCKEISAICFSLAHSLILFDITVYCTLIRRKLIAVCLPVEAFSLPTPNGHGLLSVIKWWTKGEDLHFSARPVKALACKLRSVHRVEWVIFAWLPPWLSSALLLSLVWDGNDPWNWLLSLLSSNNHGHHAM